MGETESEAVVAVGGGGPRRHCGPRSPVVAIHSDAAATGHGEWVELERHEETTLDGHKVRLRAYNGKIPGR